MKVGDLVRLKPSVLHSSANLDMHDRFGSKAPDEEPSDILGVIVSRHQNAVKVHWFCNPSSAPNRTQYTLKLKVVSEL